MWVPAAGHFFGPRMSGGGRQSLEAADRVRMLTRVAGGRFAQAQFSLRVMRITKIDGKSS